MIEYGGGTAQGSGTRQLGENGKTNKKMGSGEKKSKSLD